MNQVKPIKDRRKLLTFLIFLVISTVLWLLIKLSKDYSSQSSFTIHFTEVPVDKWISSTEQVVKFSFETDGFHTLRHNVIRPQRRFVEIGINEVKYRQEGGNTYSFSSQYVAEKLAKRIGINATDITMNEDKIYFNMDDMVSKIVPVELDLDLKTQRQYDVYGTPRITPASVTIFGSKGAIDSVNSVKTVHITKTEINQSFTETIGLDLSGQAVRTDTKDVEVGVEIEKYTEANIAVPIAIPDTLQMRFFPEKVNVKCLVAIKDYGQVKPNQFKVEIDKIQFHRNMNPIEVKLTKAPDYVRVLSTTPDKVEYLIVQ